MNLEEILKPSKSIEILIINDNNKELSFHTLIDHGFSYEDNSFSIIAPRYNGVNYPFHNGDIVTIFFTTMIANTKKVFSFKGKLLKKFKENNFIEDTIKKISEIEEIQRRTAFRLPITKNAIVFIDDVEYQILSKNISAGGIRFVVNKKLRVNSRIEILISFEDNIKIKTAAKIIESVLQKDSQYKYDTKAEFTDLKDSEKDKLINYIFSKQVEMLKKTENSDAADHIYHKLYGDYVEKRNGKDIIKEIIDGLLFFSWILLFLMIIFLVKAAPETSYGIGRFFNNAYRIKWDSNALNATFTLSAIEFIITSTGLYLMSLRNKRKTDKKNTAFLINISFSIFIMLLVLFFQIML
ncbi:MAG: PilZ domain-containing protein [Bacillota bacterium]|nr:PilZ domain-containing protein [Bacillota bacterium]